MVSLDSLDSLVNLANLDSPDNQDSLCPWATKEWSLGLWAVTA